MLKDTLVYCIVKLGKIHKLYIDVPENTKNLREFHNWIKKELIFQYSSKINAKCLLDLATGRGGDILKWKKAGLKYINAIDSDHGSIYEQEKFAGAIKRLNDLKYKTYIPKINFWEFSVTDENILHSLNNKDKNMSYDIISCQFAFHYFVKDIDIVLNLISNKLRPGGYFIGTASDGDLIKNNLENGDINLPILNIIKDDNGDKYIYEMFSGKVQNESYFDYKGAITEYFLHKDFIEKKCKEYKLELVSMQNFHEWYKDYKGYKLSIQEMVASFLNFTFVFKNIL